MLKKIAVTLSTIVLGMASIWAILYLLMGSITLLESIFNLR
mgnify:FL=1|jgi:hypothetical protein